MLFKRVIVHPGERAVVTKNGRVTSVLVPGTHLVFAPPYVTVELERHSLASALFRGASADFIAEHRPDILATHFRMVRTSDTEIAMISLGGALCHILLPGKVALLWKDAGEATVEIVHIIEEVELPSSMLDELQLSS